MTDLKYARGKVIVQVLVLAMWALFLALSGWHWWIGFILGYEAKRLLERLDLYYQARLADLKMKRAMIEVDRLYNSIWKQGTKWE